MLLEHEEQSDGWGEGLSVYFTHRLGMLSFSGILVSSVGLIYFSSFAKSQSFFGTQIDIFECAVLLLVSFVVFAVASLDYKVREDQKKNREFCSLAVQVDNYQEALENCADDIEEFRVLRKNLLKFSVMMLFNYEIKCPSAPMSFRDSEWEESKKEWRIFLGTLCLGIQTKSIEKARELLEEPYDFFATD